MTATSSQSNVDYTEHLETISTVNSDIINIESIENAVTENYIRSGKTDRYTYVVSEIANISDDNLKSYFASWALQHQISHTALSALLQRLRNHSCFSSLSLDACSLLKTLRKQEMHTVVPGTYYHFELQKSVLNILISIKSNVDSIETAINLDGLPLSKSSQHFWLTLGSIMPYNNVFAIGIYYGTEKPANVDDFLKDL
ncbi:hypothetical protein ACFW04_012929 [Cataglyphis niger]